MNYREILVPAASIQTSLNSLSKIQFRNVASTSNSWHLYPWKTRKLVVYHLVFSHQQAQGHKQHNPQRVRNTAEMSTKHPAVLREDIGLVQNDKQ